MLMYLVLIPLPAHLASFVQECLQIQILSRTRCIVRSVHGHRLALCVAIPKSDREPHKVDQAGEYDQARGYAHVGGGLKQVLLHL